MSALTSSRARAQTPTALARALVSRTRLAIAGSVWLAVVCSAVVYAARADRVYRVDVILAPVQQDDLAATIGGMPAQLGALASLAGVGAGVGAESEIAVATLTGRQFTESLIREEDLLPRLFSDRWDAEARKWKGRPPTPSDAYRLLDRGGIRTLLRDRRTGLLTLRLEHTNRDLLVDLARLSVARTNQALRQRATREATASIEYLTRELNRQPLVEVRSSIHRLIESQVKRRMLAEVRPDYALAIVDFAGRPDENDYVRPRRALIVSSAILIGALLGVAVGFGPMALRQGIWLTASRARERSMEPPSP